MLTDYLEIPLDPVRLKTAVAEAKKKLKGVKFDAIAVTGNSGTLFGGALSVALKKPIILVRKEKPNTHAHHSDYQVEGHLEADTYIFVDDFMVSGKTYATATSKIEKVNKKIKCVGVYFYRRGIFIYKND